MCGGIEEKWRVRDKNKDAWLLSELQWWLFFFSSRRRHTRLQGDWCSDVCSSDLVVVLEPRSWYIFLSINRFYAWLKTIHLKFFIMRPIVSVIAGSLYGSLTCFDLSLTNWHAKSSLTRNCFPANSYLSHSVLVLFLKFSLFSSKFPQFSLAIVNLLN